MYAKKYNKKQFLNEIKSEIQWYFDMVYPPVTKDVLDKCYDEILAIEKDDKLKESIKIDLEIRKYLNENKIEDFMGYGVDSDEDMVISANDRIDVGDPHTESFTEYI